MILSILVQHEIENFSVHFLRKTQFRYLHDSVQAGLCFIIK